MIITNKDKIIVNRGVVVNNFSLDDMTIAFISGLTTKPNTAHIKLIDTFIKQTKSILQKADVVYLMNINNTSDSFRNLVKDAHHGTVEGSGLVFDSYWGFSNPEGTGYVNTNYNPATQGINFQQNSAYVGVYKFGNNTDNYDNNMVIGQEQNTKMYLFYAINGGSFVGKGSLPFDNGLHAMRRISATQSEFVNQNINNTIRNYNSVIPHSSNFYIYRESQSPAALYPYNKGLSFVYIGGGLSDDEHKQLNDAVNDYLIQCLFLKYGHDNWGVKMAKSYFLELHNFEKYEAFEVYEFIKRHQPDYSYTPVELSINSGAQGLTDWVDSDSDGVADNWKKGGYPSTCLIITGSSFIGNAQKCIQGNLLYGHVSFAPSWTTNKTLKICFKYRADLSGRLSCDAGTTYTTLPANINNPNLFELTFTGTITSGSIRFYPNTIENSWIEIDEVSIKEVVESDVVNYNKCTNSGFGLDTDWVDGNSDGLADNWMTNLSRGIPTIVTGNGFTNRAQRMECILTESQGYVESDINLVVGNSYTFLFKYRCNGAMQLTNIFSAKTIPINTGDAVWYSITEICTSPSRTRFATAIGVGNWIEIDEVLIINNSNLQYLYNVFGNTGLNKITCDYLMLFKTGGNLIANTWSKSGAALRWNQDGSITNNNTMPAYARGSNLGIVTVTSTDGWDGLHSLDTMQSSSSVNSFYGNFPDIFKIKNSGRISLFVRTGRMKFDIRNRNVSSFVNSIGCTTISYPGYSLIDLNDFVGGNYSWFEIATYWVNLKSKIFGSVTNFNFAPSIFYCYNDYNVYGSLKNISLINMSSSGIYVQNTSISEGTLNWNKNIERYIAYGCKFNIVAVDSQLKLINDYFVLNTPIRNLTINLGGSTMGIPTGGANNTDLLGIIAKHTAAGFTASITVRTS